MRDLRAGLKGLHRTLSQTCSSATGGVGRTVMFISARSGEGVSSLAASFAVLAAERSRKGVWLVDLDLRNNQQFREFALGSFAPLFGGVGPPYSALLKTRPFFSIDPAAGDAGQGIGAFTAHRVGDLRLMVTQFDTGCLKAGQTLRIRTQPAYWQALRSANDWTVVDAPALELASAGLAIASQMDRTIIVVRADQTSPSEVEAVRRQVESHGGSVGGVILNRQKGDARFLDHLLG